MFTGAYATNPANSEKIPVYIADYVLMGYGTGAIMAVPAHDERDFAFAREYGIEIRTVIAPPDWDGEDLEGPYAGEGTMVNSDGFDGTPSSEGKEQVPAWLDGRNVGKAAVTYRLHDWLISRQRYWGTPIPMIFCDECGIVPVPEEDLPVLLPEEAEFMPTGESPLKLDPDFYNTECPRCGGPATRERTRWTRSWTPRGTGTATSRRTTTRVRSTPCAGRSGFRWTSTPAASSTPYCTCSTPVSSPR